MLLMNRVSNTILFSAEWARPPASIHSFLSGSSSNSPWVHPVIPSTSANAHVCFPVTWWTSPLHFPWKKSWNPILNSFHPILILVSNNLQYLDSFIHSAWHQKIVMCMYTWHSVTIREFKAQLSEWFDKAYNESFHRALCFLCTVPEMIDNVFWPYQQFLVSLLLTSLQNMMHFHISTLHIKNLFEIEWGFGSLEVGICRKIFHKHTLQLTVTHLITFNARIKQYLVYLPGHILCSMPNVKTVFYVWILLFCRNTEKFVGTWQKMFIMEMNLDVL